ncbi:MAG: transglycosylase SLT domain-containing protein [Betaproteobacteria bacterium]|nr:transglycosylase SLT domain-containing protein [Betaproteobacteria bacterium]
MPSTVALIAQVSDGRQSYALAASHVAAVAQHLSGFSTSRSSPEASANSAGSSWRDSRRSRTDRRLLRPAHARRHAAAARRPLLHARPAGAPHRCRGVPRADENAAARLPAAVPAGQAATGIEWRLLAALAYQESQWDPLATSETGVRGLMQLTEDTARRLGVGDRLDPRQSVEGAARYLAELKRGLPA